MTKILVISPSGEVYDHDCVRWYHRSSFAIAPDLEGIRTGPFDRPVRARSESPDKRVDLAPETIDIRLGRSSECREEESHYRRGDR